MKTTTNFGLKKPDGTDFFNVADQNDNMDKIDTALQGFKDGSTKVGNADKLDGNDSTHFATAASVKAITDGTTKVGNADKLDGKDSSYFAAANSVYSKTETDNKIQDAIDGLETGDTPIGNASSLDGHRADYFATAQSVTDIVNGNTPVGNASNAAQLGGETALQWQTKLDKIRKAVNKILSVAGWYRVILPATSTYGSFILSFYNTYGQNPAQATTLLFNGTYRDGDFFTIVSSQSKSSQSFDKVRLVKTSEGYVVDIHYIRDKSNPCYLSLINLIGFWNFDSNIPIVDTEPAEADIITTYDIPVNVGPVTNVDLADYLPLDGTAKKASQLLLTNSNEVNFGEITGKEEVYFNYRNGDTGSADNVLLKRYIFGNKCGSFDGNAILDLVEGSGVTILHTGNMSDHVLPLTGGTLNPFASIAYKASDTGGCAVGSCFVDNDGTTSGGVGMYSEGGNGMFLYMAASNEPYNIYNGLAIYPHTILWKGNEILHTGNSATVAIQSTAPTDGLWVW